MINLFFALLSGAMTLVVTGITIFFVWWLIFGDKDA